ncbi:MAG: SPASM domain-containing protein [Chitinivibrionales bacterium]
MSKFCGKALLPHNFILKHVIPAGIKHPEYTPVLKHAVKKYLFRSKPHKDTSVSQISLRVNEVCNLRCASCGQWGENGHLLEKQKRGETLDQLDFDVVSKVIHETHKDKPIYYIWGGEPTMWKHLLPTFRKLREYKLYGSIVTNSQALEPMLEDLIDTGSLGILFLSLDGWDSDSQNRMRSPASGKNSQNFEKTMRVIEKTNEIKKRKNLKFPFIMPITVVSQHNYNHLADVHRLVMDNTQLHPYYYGWFITEERAKEHEKVFKDRFGYEPRNHRGYLKSCFNDVDPKTVAEQVKEIKSISKGRESVPQFIPDIYSEDDIKKYYEDHTWDCGYPRCESIYHIAEISPNGDVTPCRDYQDYVAGNIHKSQFYDIWNGENFKKFRSEMEKGLMPVCTRCCGLQGF